MADQFCLRWNNFQTNIVSALDSLKCSEDLVDVTLTCEGRNIKAHKVILSACSPYFRNVFKENPCRHPVIILKDVSADDILSLLSYMYQGEVFIEESKLSSFLHTAALLQVKGLTGVTQQCENFFSTNDTNKLYTQLTISSKHQYNLGPKEPKLPAQKKRRSSTSDKTYDVSFADSNKKNKLQESSDVYGKNNSSQTKAESLSILHENNVDKKGEGKNEHQVTSNGKNMAQLQEDIPLTIKTERDNNNGSPVNNQTNNSDTDENLPDYENSMLARSLISGINPSKNEINQNNSLKKVPNVSDIQTISRPKESSMDSGTFPTISKSPSKILNNEDTTVKSEKLSPDSDSEYDVYISENQDGESEQFTQEQSQALLLLAGMSSVSGLASAASTSQSHQSNHAAICGDCPHCGMKYSNQSALKYHVRLMHSDLTNRLCCYLCPRSFTMRETFKEHMWTSHGQRN